MNKKIISLESKKYELKLNNFEGPLDLLCYLIDKNKMDIYKVSISDIADQYIAYLQKQEELNLYHEIYLREDNKVDIRKEIDNFINWLKTNDLYDLFCERWESKY